MSYITINPNPLHKKTGDCVVRAICVTEDKEWDDVFLELTLKAYAMKEMPTQNDVWGSYLKDLGYVRHIIPNTCPDCYTVKDFLNDHPEGTFILATGTHAIAAKDSLAYDTWDSTDEVPIYYFKKENQDA